MAKYNNQKAKILFLQQMLNETGENHTISMSEILEKLLENGIRAERKSIYDDMEVLRYFGMDIQYKRERPSGYYLIKKTDMSEKTDDKELHREENRLSWMEGSVDVDSPKGMKLLCTERGREASLVYFGNKAEFKEREDHTWLVTAPLQEDPVFFGWLTAVGTDVRLQKPKKTAQAFRSYLKNLAKEYKTEK